MRPTSCRVAGGVVVGKARAPLGDSDYSAYLVQAASSGADVVGICAGGADMINIAKQMGEFGLLQRGVTPAALNCSLTNIHSIGLQTGQGLVFSAPLLLGSRPALARVCGPVRPAAWAAADGVPGEHLGSGDALPEIGAGGGDG